MIHQYLKEDLDKCRFDKRSTQHTSGSIGTTRKACYTEYLIKVPKAAYDTTDYKKG